MKTFCIEINKEQPEWKVIQVFIIKGIPNNHTRF